jgi:Holliday junction DNA helicase RuvA
MIAHIQGRLIEKTPTQVVIDCGGVGYQIHISLHTYSQIEQTENLRLYTYLQIKDDAHTLFGFIDKIERELFKLLISVSGIGGNTARRFPRGSSPRGSRLDHRVDRPDVEGRTNDCRS